MIGFRLLIAGAVCLLAACAAAPAATLLPSLTPSPDIQVAVEATLTALAQTPAAAPAPITAAATPAGDLNTPEATDEAPIVITIPALAGQRIAPPLDITLPQGWQTVGYDVLLLNDMGELRGVPVAVYRGPVTGGVGTIALLWGFPNIVAAGPLDASTARPDLWADGLRLLRIAVLEADCNIGTDLKRSYRVGLLSGVGTQFSAVDCPELPNTRGWFVGVQESGLNFVFYAYGEGPALTDPNSVEAFRVASDEMQAVLETVRFRVPQVTVTPPTPAPPG